VPTIAGLRKEQTMNNYDIYKYEEFIIFMLYLIFFFISVHVWFLWKNIDKGELKRFINGSFIKKNYAYLSAAIIFSMIHEFVEGATVSDTVEYFELLEMLTTLSLVLLGYEWYSLFKRCAHKKLSQEFTD
jgi:hypothetical protein